MKICCFVLWLACCGQLSATEFGRGGIGSHAGSALSPPDTYGFFTDESAAEPAVLFQMWGAGGNGAVADGGFGGHIVGLYEDGSTYNFVPGSGYVDLTISNGSGSWTLRAFNGGDAHGVTGGIGGGFDLGGYAKAIGFNGYSGETLGGNGEGVPEPASALLLLGFASLLARRQRS